MNSTKRKQLIYYFNYYLKAKRNFQIRGKNKDILIVNFSLIKGKKINAIFFPLISSFSYFNDYLFWASTNIFIKIYEHL